MGVCHSTKNKSKKTDDDMELNYDEYLDELRDAKEKDKDQIDFEVVGKLLEYNQIKEKEIPTIRKYCKYFFINTSTGKIRSKIKSKLGDIHIDGEIDRKGKFKITSKFECAGNIVEKLFESQLICSDSSLEGKGVVIKINEFGDNTPQDGITFLLDFSSDVWRGNYTFKNTIVDIKGYMKIRVGKEKKTLSGMSLDEKGLSLWIGFITIDNKVTLQQSFIGREIKQKSITYGGIYSPALNLISGTILDRDGVDDKVTIYSITLEKNPKKNSIKK